MSSACRDRMQTAPRSYAHATETAPQIHLVTCAETYWWQLEEPDDEARLEASVAAVHALVELQIADGIAPSRIIVGGFSQGAAVAAWVVRRRCTSRVPPAAAMAPLRPFTRRCDRRKMPVPHAHQHLSAAAAALTLLTTTNASDRRRRLRARIGSAALPCGPATPRAPPNSPTPSGPRPIRPPSPHLRRG